MSERLDDFPYDVAELVRKAELDFMTVQRLEPAILAEVICFHCQQCAEKYLKAVISSRGTVPDRIHDLLVLHVRASGLGVAREELLPDLALLNPYAVVVRYEGTASPEMACRAIAAMERVRAALRETLGIEDAHAQTEHEAEEPDDEDDDDSGD